MSGVEPGALLGDNKGMVSWSYATGAVAGVVIRQYQRWLLGHDNQRRAGNIANDPGITGLTNSKLASRLPEGLSKKIWAENPAVNGELPCLTANLPPGD